MTRRRWFEAPVDQPWISRLVCAFPTIAELQGWWGRFYHWLTHAGQWSEPEWDLELDDYKRGDNHDKELDRRRDQE